MRLPALLDHARRSPLAADALTEIVLAGSAALARQRVHVLVAAVALGHRLVFVLVVGLLPVAVLLFFGSHSLADVHFAESENVTRTPAFVRVAVTSGVSRPDAK